MPLDGSSSPENHRSTRKHTNESPIVDETPGIPDPSMLLRHLDEMHTLHSRQRLLAPAVDQSLSTTGTNYTIDANLDPTLMSAGGAPDNVSPEFQNTYRPPSEYSLPAWVGNPSAQQENNFISALGTERQDWGGATNLAYMPRNMVFELAGSTLAASGRAPTLNKELAQSQLYMDYSVLPDQFTSRSETNVRVPIPRRASTLSPGTQRTQSERRFPCDLCPQECSREPDLQRHKGTKHGLADVIYVCTDCDFTHCRKDKMLDHQQKNKSHSCYLRKINQSAPL